MNEHVSKGIAVLSACLGVSILIATIVGSVVVVRMSSAELERNRRDERVRAQEAIDQVSGMIVDTLEELPNPQILCGDDLIDFVKQALENVKPK